MATIDWLILLVYLLLTSALGLYLSRRAAASLTNFLGTGQSLPWWLAGTSMAATASSVETPLYMAGVVGTQVPTSSWIGFSALIASVAMIYPFARLWHRSGVLTDAELTELRYGGAPAAWLRRMKACLWALPLSGIGIGYTLLVMVNVLTGLGLWQSLGFEAEAEAALQRWSIVGVSLWVLIYTGFSGLWGVVATDFFQFFVTWLGAAIVAIAAVATLGGLDSLISQIQLISNDPVSAIALQSRETEITISTLLGYGVMRRWALPNGDGSGAFAQRLLATQTEAAAAQAAWCFNILYYLIRPWPWVIITLATLVAYPDLPDRGLAYPQLMLDTLPPPLLGLAIAALLAAFMSTLSTLINWGASYLSHDLYSRFIRPSATPAEAVRAGRIASVLVTVAGAAVALVATDVIPLVTLVITVGSGWGPVLILRWFWWRINAAAELTAIVSALLIGIATSEISAWQVDDLGLRLLITSSLATVLWLSVMVLTPPESDATLERFYRRVRPGGLGWWRQRSRTGLPPAQALDHDLQQMLAALLLLLGLILAIGSFLFYHRLSGWSGLLVAGLSGYWLQRLGRYVLPMPRPGLSDEGYDDR